MAAEDMNVLPHGGADKIITLVVGCGFCSSLNLWLGPTILEVDGISSTLSNIDTTIDTTDRYD